MGDVQHPENGRDPCRRPLEAHELAPLRDLGARLRDLRLRAGLTQHELADRAELHRQQILRLELGRRRTRASTLERIAGALVAACPELGDGAALASDLARVAGPGLAPESIYRERVEHRRRRRLARRARRSLYARLHGIDDAMHALRVAARFLGKPIRSPADALARMRALDAVDAASRSLGIRRPRRR